MIKRFVVIIFLFTLFKLSSSENKISYTPKVNNLRLRTDQSLNSNIIKIINMGDILDLIEKGNSVKIDNINGNWVKVKHYKSIGWCFDGYLQDTKNIQCMDYLWQREVYIINKINEENFSNDINIIKNKYGEYNILKEEKLYSPLVNDYLVGKRMILKFNNNLILTVIYLEDKKIYMTQMIEIESDKIKLFNDIGVGITKDDLVGKITNNFEEKVKNVLNFNATNIGAEIGEMKFYLENDIVKKIEISYKLFD